MPRTHEMIESKYLRKEDVGRGKLVTIRSLSKETLQVPGEQPKQKWIMSFDEFDKGLVLGPTTIGQCEIACGSDLTDDWIGQRVVLYDDPTIMFAGKVTGGIRVRAPKLPPAPPPPIASAAPAVVLQKRGPGPFEDMDDDIPF